ncbi:MAG: hypothetical protein KAG84_02190 [Bacteroidales bacterium]|nr:hypothetical protein [Bacteroidales bacterium]
MSFLLKVRNYVQQNEALHWQYLLLVLLLSVFGAVSAFYLQVLYGYYLIYIISFLSVFMQSIVSYLFMVEKGEARKIFFNLLFAAFTFLLAKYLIFEHYYDYFLEAYIDRSYISIDHIIFYFRELNFDSIFMFVDNMPNFMSIFDYVFLVILLIITVLYKMLSFSDLPNISEDRVKRVRYNKRRF